MYEKWWKKSERTRVERTKTADFDKSCHPEGQGSSTVPITRSGRANTHLRITLPYGQRQGLEVEAGEMDRNLIRSITLSLSYSLRPPDE